MKPRLRKFALTAHVTFSVGWLGAVVAFLALSVAGLTSQDTDMVRAVYIAAEPIAFVGILPLALASLLTGLVQALGTTWGLFRHYWVLFKLVLNLFASIVLLLYMQTVRYLAGIATDGGNIAELRSPTFVLHSVGALLVLLAATVLAVYKPRGVTPYGQRKQQEQRLANTRDTPSRRRTDAN